MTGPVLLRPARADEHASIAALALRSKGHWGYDEAFLEACRDELTWGPHQVGQVVVATVDDRLIGFHELSGEPPTGELTALFVDPDSIGSGTGGVLLRDALRAAREDGFVRLRLAADPQAEEFYLHHGARRVGESPSGSLAGRLLPVLEFALG